VRAVLDDYAFLALTTDSSVLLTTSRNGSDPRAPGVVQVVRMETLEHWLWTSRVPGVVLGFGVFGLFGTFLCLGVYFKTGKVRAVVFSPDGQLVASALGGTVRVWDVAAERLLVTVRPGWGRVQALLFAADARTLSVLTAHGTVVVCDVATGAHQNRHRLPCRDVGSAAFSPDGRLIAGLVARILEHTLHLWEVGGEQPGVRLRAALRAGSRPCGPILFSADGQTVALRSLEGVKVWDLGGGGPPRQRFLPGLPCAAFALSPDGRTVALSGHRQAGITIRDTLREEEICSLALREAAPERLALSPDGRTLAGTRGSHLRLWDLVDGRMWKLPSKGLLRAVAFSPDGRTLAVGDAAGGVCWYDVAVARRNAPFAQRSPLRRGSGEEGT
jgi:WD40 repeat protein